jgi:alkylhydroperoxidase/carboxymuconolactone decarboxylase family protein YurZ
MRLRSAVNPALRFHVHDALAAVATRAKVLETLGVAVMMGGGGPAAMNACEAFTALEQFESEKKQG